MSDAGQQAHQASLAPYTMYNGRWCGKEPFALMRKPRPPGIPTPDHASMDPDITVRTQFEKCTLLPSTAQAAVRALLLLSQTSVQMWGRLWRTARHAGKSTAGFVNNGTWRQHARQASSAFARLAEDTPTGTRFSALFAAAALSGHVANSDSEWNPLPVPQKDTAHKRPGSKFQNLPEMIEACFPAICKIQGAVGDSAYPLVQHSHRSSM